MEFKAEVTHVPTGKTLARTIISESEMSEFIGYINDSDVFSVKIPIYTSSKETSTCIVIRKALLDECVFSFQGIAEEGIMDEPTSR
jgi:hypothetical protein